MAFLSGLRLTTLPLPLRALLPGWRLPAFVRMRRLPWVVARRYRLPTLRHTGWCRLICPALQLLLLALRPPAHGILLLVLCLPALRLLLLARPLGLSRSGGLDLRLGRALRPLRRLIALRLRLHRLTALLQALPLGVL